MQHPNIASREEWIEARKALLAQEKAFNKQRDQLSAQRRALPWVKIDTDYVFQGVDGEASLADLFGDKSQLFVFHFMYGRDWNEGCPSCSFWADNFNGIDIHLAHRDTRMVLISNGPLDKLQAYRERMGWDFDWYSAHDNNFGQDFGVSFDPASLEAGTAVYNYDKTWSNGTDGPGFSVFCKETDGTVYHTYSCFARGLDMMNGAYHIMDLLPKGRDEQDLPYTMAWLRRHDQYED